jgi:large conductance mechanosensitive channel
MFKQQLSKEKPGMSMLKDFRAFAIKGNVVDLAVGVIIGGAFGKIVSSLVEDIIMPIVGKIFGGLDFANYYLPLNGQAYGLPLAEAKKAGAVFAYGNFLTIFINFLILAFIIFQMVRAINKARDLASKHEEATPAAPAPTPEDVLLLREIRDSLKKQG